MFRYSIVVVRLCLMLFVVCSCVLLFVVYCLWLCIGRCCVFFELCSFLCAMCLFALCHVLLIS